MVEPNPRPLPETLTRFLAAPTTRIIDRPPDRRLTGSVPVPRRSNNALKIAVTWAVCYNIAGACILFWLLTTMGM